MDDRWLIAPVQDKYKAAVASAAGTIAENIEILSITETRRRAASAREIMRRQSASVNVDTKVSGQRAIPVAGSPDLSVFSCQCVPAN